MAKRTNRRRPPWGSLLGKPIERIFPRDHPQFGAGAEKEALGEQFEKMERLREYFQITGKGWYQLALTLARELDPALEILDPPPEPDGKTAPRWRGAEGLVLVGEIEALRAEYPDSSYRALLATHQEFCPRYSKMNLDELERRFHEARKYYTAKRNAK